MKRLVQLISVFKYILYFTCYVSHHTLSRLEVYCEREREGGGEEKEKTEKRFPRSGIEYFIFFHYLIDYFRGISEMKKVSHRISSEIPLFAVSPLPLLFLIFFCDLVNHSFLGCRDSQPLYFLILIAAPFFPVLLTATAEIPPSLFLSIFCNQFVSLFHLVFFLFVCNRGISCCSIVDKTRRRKILNLRGFFRAIEKCRSWLNQS